MPSIVLCHNTITAESAIRNLGVILDSRLDSSAQVSAIIKACNYHLSQIARVHQYITERACKLAVLGLVIETFCQATGTDCAHHTDLKTTSLASKSVFQSAVRYKLCLIVHNSLHGTGPQYLRELLKLYVRDKRLRQASYLQLIPCHPKRKMGRAGFRVAGPDAWHTLPAAIRSIDSKTVFK